jgi:hypothetical protein
MNMDLREVLKKVGINKGIAIRGVQVRSGPGRAGAWGWSGVV